jgi:hypothetical protein
VLYLLVVRWHTHFTSCIMVPNTCSDALPSPGVNPLRGFTKV